MGRVNQGVVGLSFLADDLDRLRAAYASGTLKVRFADGREVTYPSGDDLLRRINTVAGELSRASSGSTRTTTTTAAFSRD